jgi:hypothetical protein
MATYDPDEGVRKLFEEWQQDVVCFPSWNELLELEYVRRYGDINMFTDDVIMFCETRGLSNAAAWLKRLKATGVMPTHVFKISVAHYEKSQGPIDSWLTEDLLRLWMCNLTK